MEKFKIGEISKLLDINETSIRYFDQIGVVHARKDEHSGYRRFDEVDLHNLMHYKMYQSCGFSQNDAKNCIYEYSLRQVEECCHDSIASIDRQLQIMQLTREVLQEKEEYLHYVGEEVGKLRFEKRKAGYILLYHQHETGKAVRLLLDPSDKVIGQWMKSFPIVKMTPFIYRDDFVSRSSMQYSGFWVAEDMVDILELTLPERCIYLPETEVLTYTFTRSKAMDKPFYSYGEAVYEYCSAHQMAVAGHITFRQYIALEKSSRHLFYGTMEVPVADKSTDFT